MPAAAISVPAAGLALAIPGGDTLAGGAGADILLAGLGVDTNFLDGGSGPDRLGAGAKDFLSGGVAFCGPGSDQVRPEKERDRIRQDCESASFDLPMHGLSADGKGIECRTESVPPEPRLDQLPGDMPDGHAPGKTSDENWCLLAS